MIAVLFTATEASMVTVIYTLAITLFLYRTIKYREILPMLKGTGLRSAIPMFCRVCWFPTWYRCNDTNTGEKT